MAYSRLTLIARVDEVEALVALLEGRGATSVALSGASGEPVFDDSGLWAETRIEALFAERGSAEAAAAASVVRAPALRRVTGGEIAEIRDRDWAVAWQEGLAPRCFGGRLWVHPSFAVPDTAGLRILIDPGMAFGTGSHPTTGLCLEWLAEAGELAGSEVLDYGCGSGILALAALRLGARRAYAVDCDQTALAVTRENAVKNDLASRLVTATPDALGVARVDVILANILLEPLLELAPRFADLLVPGGRLVLSGILAHQAPRCAAAYAPSFSLAPAILSGEWALLAGTRHSFGPPVGGLGNAPIR